MIVLDTNLVSELMLPKPHPDVVRWMDHQPSLSFWTTAITVYEIRFGLQSMPPGRKRSALLDFFESWLNNVIQERIIAFDHAAARFAADLAAAGKAAGRPRDARDAMIAGIVLANHATLATRNIRHFDDIAKSVVNPWEH